MLWLLLQARRREAGRGGFSKHKGEEHIKRKTYFNNQLNAKILLFYNDTYCYRIKEFVH